MLEFTKEQELELELNKYKKFCRLFSVLRLITAICFVVPVVCLICLDNYPLYGIMSGLTFCGFILMVVASSDFYRRAAVLECKKKVYARHKQRREKKFSHFADFGTEFKTKEDYKLSDLDVFGPKSLYQYLCEAKTPKGRKLLAKQLSNPDCMDEEFTLMVSHLAMDEESIEIEALLQEFKNKANFSTTDEFTSAVSEKIQWKWQYNLPLVSFIGLLISIVLMLVFKRMYYLPLVFLVLNVVLSKLCIKDEILTKDAGPYYYLSDLYYELAKSIDTTKIEDIRYKKLKNCIHDEMGDLKRIRKVYGILRIRRNIILNIILNLICCFDTFVIFACRCWIKNGIHLEKSLDAIAEIELALSFKNIGMDNPEYCIPSASDSIVAVDITHPFVKCCVGNSIELDGGILLTGSNMSGKTTFMRTLGVCVLLKNAGSIVPAKSFKAPRLNIYTSLRANDMLQEGVSTFYAEIERMKKINQAIKEEKCLVLVDEIFKGTNALERISASQKVIEKLNTYHTFYIVSTHDFELCETKGIINYHFEESYQDNQIYFDYTLKAGSGTKGNALYLLKMSGILEE